MQHQRKRLRTFPDQIEHIGVGGETTVPIGAPLDDDGVLQLRQACEIGKAHV